MSMILWEKMFKKNYIPNALSILRAFLGLMVFYLIYHNHYGFAFIVFIVAAFSDYADGYLARKLQWVTSLGKIIDPIADKLLILATLLGFTLKGFIWPPFIIIIGLREVIITAIRLYLLKNATVLAAKDAGKIKTVLQITVIIIIFLFFIFKDCCPAVLNHEMLLHYIANLLMFTLLVITVASMVAYIKDIKKVFRNA